MPAVVDLRTEGAACSRSGYEGVAMLRSVKSERDERQGLSIDNRAVESATCAEYDVITNLDSQPAGYFVASPCTSVAGAATSQLGSFCGS